MTKELKPQEVLTTAIGLIRSANSSLELTMQAQEEIANPLPDEYFSLLKEKLDEGVHITRIGFGRESDFKPIEDRIQIAHENYEFVRTDAADYRRMLLVDGLRLMFAKTQDGKRHVFYTEDPALTDEYRAYFNAHKPV